MKVWILEKFISPDEMKKDHDEMVEICHHFAETGEATPEAIAHVEEGIKKYESKWLRIRTATGADIKARSTTATFANVPRKP